MKLTSLGLLATGLLATGCVSQGRFDAVKTHEAELTWRVDAADKSVTRLESDKKMAQREAELAKDEARVLREKLALANDALKDAKKDVDEELKARLAELQQKAPGKLELSPYGGVVLESGILFAPGRFELTKEGEAALAPLCDSLTGPKYEGFEIEVSGHTDSDPLKATAKIYADNHELAAKRANSVRHFLVSKGVPTARIYLSAWGETRPLATASKAANRRVEIRLHHTQGVELAGGARKGEDETRPASTPRPADARPDAESDAGDEAK
jgi:chemotaxis protein MotB